MAVRAVAFCFALTLCLSIDAGAQSFPGRPLHIIVPLPAGATSDITTRELAEHLSRSLGQPVVVENRPGAGLTVGYELGARAPADGHTLLVVWPSFVISPVLRPNVTFDPVRDFKAVAQTIAMPMAIAVDPALPIKSLDDLIAHARTNPGKLAYGTAGAGTSNHIVAEMLKQSAHIDITHVPFQGDAPAITALMGGHVPMVVVNASSLAPHLKTGKIRMIVVTSPERDSTLPDVPTVRESGHPELEATNWSGLVVPAGTPPAVVERLNTELVRALRTPAVHEKFKALAISPAPSTPEQFNALLQSEAARYGAVVRAAGIKVD